MIFGPPPPQPTGYLDLIKEENRHQEAMQCAAYRRMIAELQVRIAELERELETYKSQWKHALETYGEQEFKITNLTIENERLKDELDRERSDCAELDQENERLKQELEEMDR